MASPRMGLPGRAGRGALVATALLLSCPVGPAFAAGLTLAWDANTEADLAGYRIHVGRASRTYTKSFTVPRSADPTRKTVAFRVTGLQRGVRYYFAARACDQSGNCSGYSNQVSYRVPACADTVTVPRRPNGRTAAAPAQSLTFLTRGSTAVPGHPVQYRFSWGNGRNSAWLPVGTRSARNRWPARGAFLVRAQARCAIHREITSGWSGGLKVTVR